jgi:bifunctional DNA-binding transcriptional regulator/antitoxin component of YhaV-PrlF toxin-antitoxin module
MSRRIEDETTVNESGAVTVPAAVRRVAGVEAGDKLRWSVDDGALSVRVIKPQYSAFSDLDPVDTFDSTDAAADHDLIAGDH